MRKVKNGLPVKLFRGGRNIDRNDFFAEFQTVNPSQSICAICDEHAFHTQTGRKLSQRYRALFPKIHLSSYGLSPIKPVPICGPCNTIHQDKDPLKCPNGSRRNINEIFLPYRSINLDQMAAIKITHSAGLPTNREPAKKPSSGVRFEILGRESKNGSRITGKDYDYGCNL